MLHWGIVERNTTALSETSSCNGMEITRRAKRCRNDNAVTDKFLRQLLLIDPNKESDGMCGMNISYNNIIHCFFYLSLHVCNNLLEFNNAELPANNPLQPVINIIPIAFVADALFPYQ